MPSEPPPDQTYLPGLLHLQAGKFGHVVPIHSPELSEREM